MIEELIWCGTYFSHKYCTNIHLHTIIHICPVVLIIEVSFGFLASYTATPVIKVLIWISVETIVIGFVSPITITYFIQSLPMLLDTTK